MQDPAGDPKAAPGAASDAPPGGLSTPRTETMGEHKQPVSFPETLPLTFKGLEWCDGCGVRLVPGDRLSGLCAANKGIRALAS